MCQVSLKMSCFELLEGLKKLIKFIQLNHGLLIPEKYIGSIEHASIKVLTKKFKVLLCKLPICDIVRVYTKSIYFNNKKELLLLVGEVVENFYTVEAYQLAKDIVTAYKRK